MMIKALITTLILGSSTLAMAHPAPVRENVTHVAPVHNVVAARQAPIRERGHGPVVVKNDNRTSYVRGEIRGERIGEVRGERTEIRNDRAAEIRNDRAAEIRGERIERNRLENLRLERDRYYVGGQFTRPWISLCAPAPIYGGQLAVSIAPEYSTVSTIELMAEGGATFVQSIGITYADGHVQNVPMNVELTSSYDLPLDGSGIAPTNVTVYGQSAVGATVAVTAL